MVRKATVKQYQETLAASSAATANGQADDYSPLSLTMRDTVHCSGCNAEMSEGEHVAEYHREQSPGCWTRPAADDLEANPFAGMVVEVEAGAAFGLFEAAVRAWADAAGVIVQEHEIRAEANRLYELASAEARPFGQAGTVLTDASGVVVGFTPDEAERELPGMPGNPEAPAAEPVTLDNRLASPSVWGKVERAAEKAALLWPIPQTSRFEGQLVAAHDLDELVDELVRRTPPLGLLAPLNIAWYWRLKGGRAGGKPVLSRVRPADPTLTHERHIDVVVTLSADHLRKMRASCLFVERIVFDALVRIDPAGPRVLPDDEWNRLPGRWRYGWLGAEERLYAGLVELVQHSAVADATRDLTADPVAADEPADGQAGAELGCDVCGGYVDLEAEETRCVSCVADKLQPADPREIGRCWRCNAVMVLAELAGDDLAEALAHPTRAECATCRADIEAEEEPPDWIETDEDRYQPGDVDERDDSGELDSDPNDIDHAE